MTPLARPITGLAIIACVAVVGCSRRPAESDGGAKHRADAKPRTTTVRFADLVNVDVRNVPLLMAFDDLATRGYVVEKIHLTSGVLLADLLARGDADVAMINDQTAWSAISKGADIRTIAQYTAATTVLAARENIHSCRDLDHRRLGVATSSGLSVLLFRLYFDRSCPGSEPERLVIPEAAGRSAALLTGRLDASTMPSDELIKLQRQSSVPIHSLMSYAEEFPDTEVDGLHVRRAWATRNPEIVKDLLRAQLHAHRQIQANPQLLYDESARRLGLDAATARAIGESHLQLGIWDANGGLTREQIQSTIEFLVQAEALPAGMTPDQVADLSFLDAVLREIGRLPDGKSQQGSGPSR